MTLRSDLLEVLQGPANDQFTRGRRTGQILDGIMKLKQHGIGQPPQRFETLLRASLLNPGDARLAHNGYSSGDDNQSENCRRCQGEFLALDELAAPVAEGATTG